MAMDEATRASLEVLVSTGGSRKGSLVEAIDRCVTGAGARLLADDLSAPLTDATAIRARLELVSWLHDDPLLRGDVRTVLRALQKTKQTEQAGLPSPCDCLHGVGPAARSRSTSYAGVRPDGLVARSHRARIKSCFGHTAFADLLGRITFDNLSPNSHEPSRRQRNIL